MPTTDTNTDPDTDKNIATDAHESTRQYKAHKDGAAMGKRASQTQRRRHRAATVSATTATHTASKPLMPIRIRAPALHVRTRNTHLHTRTWIADQEVGEGEQQQVDDALLRRQQVDDALLRRRKARPSSIFPMAIFGACRPRPLEW